MSLKSKRRLIVILVFSAFVVSMAAWWLTAWRMQEQRKVISKLLGTLDTPWTSCHIEILKGHKSVQINESQAIHTIVTDLKDIIGKEAARVYAGEVFQLVTYYHLELKSSQTSLRLKFGHNPKEAYIEYGYSHSRFIGTIFFRQDVAEVFSAFLDRSL